MAPPISTENVPAVCITIWKYPKIRYSCTDSSQPTCQRHQASLPTEEPKAAEIIPIEVKSEDPVVQAIESTGEATTPLSTSEVEKVVEEAHSPTKDKPDEPVAQPSAAVEEEEEEKKPEPAPQEATPPGTCPYSPRPPS